MAWIHKLRVCLISTAAVMLIILAVVFTALRAFLPHATEYVSDIQQLLSHQVGLPVSIDSIDADMKWFTPRLKLINVVIYKEDGRKELLRLDEAIFELSYIDSLFGLSPVVGEIDLVGADIYIERHPENRWVVQGIELASSDSSAPSGELMALIQNTNFSLLDSDIHWKDYTRQAEQIDFIGVNLTFESFLGEHSLAVDFLLPEGYGDTFWFVAKIDDDLEKYETAEWEFYLEGQTINVNKILSELDLAEIPRISGTLDGKVWLKLKNKEVLRVTGDLSVNTLELGNKDFEQRQWHADYVTAQFDWKEMEEGWRLDVQDLMIVKNNDAWAEVTNITAIDNNESGLRATASYMRPFDLLGLPGVFLASKNLSEMEKINTMYLGGDLYNIEVHFPGEVDAEPEVSAVFVDVDLRLADTGIKLQGADGEYKHKRGHISLNLLSESLTIDFGDLFRQPVYIERLTGEIVVRLEDYNWFIESSDIHFLNEDIEAHSRLKVVLDKDGEVFVDAQTDFINAKGASVSKYYPLPVMSDTLVEWLDSAITDGVVEKGSFILFGDVEQFPYAQNDGVMEVVFAGKGLSLQFFEGWPKIEDLNAEVRFYNSSLTIYNGTGRTYGGVLEQVAVSIPDLDSPILYVQGNVTAPADDLQKYIWNSGLNDILGDVMNQLQVSGEMGVKLSLEIPLDDDDVVVKTKGELDFTNNELYFPAMEYSLKDVSGKLAFTESDMSGSGLVATFEGAPVNINAYGKGNNLKHETIFHLEGNLPVDGLLKRFDWIPDFWVSGSSDWDILVRIPDEAKEYDLRVEMQSALEGVSVNLSDALSKPPEDVLHLEMSVDVLDEVLQVDVDSTDVLNLFATRDDKANWDFVVDSRLLRGSGEFAEDLNKDSTVRLRLEHASLYKLTYKSDESNSAPLKPTMFPPLNISVKNLKWEDWAFTNVNLETNWHAHGMLINKFTLEGPSLKVSGRGSWLDTWRNEDETNFNFHVESPDLGNLLSTLGISDSVKRGESVSTLNWKWPAEPYRFSWGVLKGTSHFEIKNGEVTDLEPGAGGRLLGLFNVFKLADRLSLDFDDVYKDGFAFDSIVGDYEYDEGDVYTKDLQVKAAAADMKIKGRIGLVERDYDLNMRVKPHTSAAVFTGGALLGGLVTGAAAVLINKVLGIEKLARDEYTVTGSWDDPDVKLISKRQQEEQVSEQVDENGSDDEL